MVRTWTFPKYTELAPAVKRFFEILDQRESSDSGRDFNPVQMDYKELQISSVRVILTAELTDLLPQMRALSDAK